MVFHLIIKLNLRFLGGIWRKYLAEREIMANFARHYE